MYMYEERMVCTLCTWDIFVASDDNQGYRGNQSALTHKIKSNYYSSGVVPEYRILCLLCSTSSIGV